MKFSSVILIVLITATNVAGRLHSPASVPPDSLMRSRVMKPKRKKATKRRKKKSTKSSKSESCNGSKSSKSSRSCVTSVTNANTVPFSGNILYENDFESPKSSVDILRTGCPIDIFETINDQYGTAENQFRQSKTTEVVALTGQMCTADEPYVATSEKGGMYSLGMNLGPRDGDRTAVAFSAGNYKYVNVKMDLSTLGMPGCEGTHPVDIDPQINILLMIRQILSLS